jgi:hypothetical protein
MLVILSLENKAAAPLMRIPMLAAMLVILSLEN